MGKKEWLVIAWVKPVTIKNRPKINGPLRTVLDI